MQRRGAFNACAGKQERTIATDARQVMDRISVKLTDDGCGMSEREIELAFTPMGVPKPGHLHLGLCAARRLAESYGASLEVTSDRDSGTTVTVTLPSAK